MSPAWSSAPDNPFYLYHLKLWTILHQICALLLRAGLSEIALSKLVSGLLGMVSFQAIAMIVYALSRDELLAVGSAFLIAFTRTAEHGVNYPVHLMGTPHTYGVIGLSLIALIAGFAGAGWYRASGFLLGIAPAVHPSLGAWFMLTMGAAALWHAWRDRAEIRPALRFVLAGCSVTAISLLVQFVQSRGTPTIESQLANRYLTSFVSVWDTHRQPVSPWPTGRNSLWSTLTLAMAEAVPWPARFCEVPVETGDRHRDSESYAGAAVVHPAGCAPVHAAHPDAGTSRQLRCARSRLRSDRTRRPRLAKPAAVLERASCAVR